MYSCMYKRRVACLTHQALNVKELPADIQDIVTIQSTTRNMRDNLKLALQRPKNQIWKKNVQTQSSNYMEHITRIPKKAGKLFYLKKIFDKAWQNFRWSHLW